jgi:DNA-binding NarL/FixJ family response regulator
MKTVTRVLMIEDNPSDALLLEATLAEASPTYVITHVERLSLGVSRLASGAFDIVMADLSLPDSQGVSTVQQLRAAAPDMPVIVLSGLDDEETALRAVQAGAEGYLVKWRFGANLLTRTMAHAIEHRQQLTRLEERLAILESRQAVCERTLQLMVEGLIVVGSDGVIVQANPAAASILGRPVADLLGAYVGQIDEADPRRALASLAYSGTKGPEAVRVATVAAATSVSTLLLFR